jgi:hypothetical protein
LAIESAEIDTSMLLRELAAMIGSRYGTVWYGTVSSGVESKKGANTDDGYQLVTVVDDESMHCIDTVE